MSLNSSSKLPLEAYSKLHKTKNLRASLAYDQKTTAYLEVESSKHLSKAHKEYQTEGLTWAVARGSFQHYKHGLVIGVESSPIQLAQKTSFMFSLYNNLFVIIIIGMELFCFKP